MAMNKSFVGGIRFLFVSAAVIFLGATICSMYDINIIDDLRQEIKNFNALEELLSYYTLYNDKILRHINYSSLPFLYAFSINNSEQGFIILLSEVITINIVFSELYCRISRYDKHLYSKPVRLIFNLVGIVSEFALSYCSYAFLVFISLILPDNFGSTLFSNLSFNYSSDIKVAAFSQIKMLFTVVGIACFLGIILIACLPHYIALIMTCIVALAIGLFSSDYNKFSLLFILLGIVTKWFLGSNDVCAEMRKSTAFNWILPVLFFAAIVVIAYSLFLLFL